jgi:hypothetical protein
VGGKSSKIGLKILVCFGLSFCGETTTLYNPASSLQLTITY